MLTEFHVGMTPTSIPPGAPVTFAATNKGYMNREVVPEKARAADQPLGMDGQETGIEDIAMKISSGMRIGRQPERPWSCQQRRPPRSP